jgi:hypothetical protein
MPIELHPDYFVVSLHGPAFAVGKVFRLWT